MPVFNVFKNDDEVRMSGNFGHAGRPGKVGGSVSKGKGKGSGPVEDLLGRPHGISKTIDLRKNHSQKSEIKSKSDKSTGTLYRKGRVVQLWWKTDVLGRKMVKPETWTSTTKQQAKEAFKDLKERMNE
jgi:hypothetical protein